MGTDRDPSAGQPGSVGSAAVTSYRLGSTEAVSGGVRVIGAETITWPSDTTFAAAMHADGQTVVLDVNSASFGLTREAARILGAELSRLGQEQSAPVLPAGRQQLADFAADAIRDVAAVQQEGR